MKVMSLVTHHTYHSNQHAHSISQHHNYLTQNWWVLIQIKLRPDTGN